MSTSRYEIGWEGDKSPELRYITYSRYDNEWISVEHSHAIAEMLYIISGEGQVAIASQRHRIAKDDFVIIPPHWMHTEFSSSAQPLEYLCIGVSGVDIVSGIEDFDPIVDLGVARGQVSGMMTGIYREMQRKLPEYEIMAKSLFYSLLVKLVRDRIIDVSQDEERLMRSNIAEVKRYIDAHYAESFTLDDLASIAALSKYHLVREFKAATGASPMDYLLARRITESKKLLAGTEYPISDIAESVGFSSSSYFSQRFHKVTGMTPMSWRRNSLGGLP